MEYPVGIRQFLKPGKSINALFKYKFSDFIVQEISKTHEISPIDQSDIQKLLFQKSSFEQQEKPKYQKKDNVMEKFKLKDNFFLESRELLGVTVTDEIVKMVEGIQCGDKQSSFLLDVGTFSDKDKRTEVHKFIKLHLPFCESQTVNGIIKLKISPFNMKRVKCELEHSGTITMVDDKKYKYVRCDLVKCNIDSLGASMQICKMLNVKSKFIQMAGIKDKRGITSQKITIFGHTQFELISAQNNAHWNNNIILKNFNSQDEELKLGMLQGNKFTIVLRIAEQHSLELVQEFQDSLTSLISNGFINYFGLQRFGNNPSIQTNQIGKLILMQQWEQAFKSIILSSEKEKYDQKKELLEQGNYKDLMKIIPYKQRIEKMLVESIVRSGQKTNFFGAIQSLPRNVKQLYLHALQSYLWNVMASTRIQQYGTIVKIGDIAIKNFEEPTLLDESCCSQEEMEEENEMPETVLINEENINQYSFADLVIPIVGSLIQVPEGSLMNKILQDLLSEENIRIEDFDKLEKEFNVRGGWRKIINKPFDVQAFVCGYSNKDTEIILERPDILNSESHSLDLVKEYNEAKKEQYLSFVVKMSLVKSCYATMAIREIVKSTSSMENQQALNDFYNEKQE